MKKRVDFILLYFLSSLMSYSQINEINLFDKHTDYSFQLLETDSLDPQNVRDILLADINNDTYKDIVCITDQAGDIRTQEYSFLIIFENQGDGTFLKGKEVHCGSIYNDISFGKINNDEYSDIILYGDTLSILLNDGSGNFKINNVYQHMAGLSASVSKLNEDDYDDIALTDWSDSTEFAILLNNGIGEFNSLSNYDINLEEGWWCTDIACIDLNNDNINDVSACMWLNDIAGTIYNYLNDGDGKLTFISKYEFSFEVGNFTWTDINNDGNIDVMVRRRLPTRLVVVFGNGDGILSNVFEYYTEFLEINSTDVNNDGYKDVVLTSVDSLKRLVNDFKNYNNNFIIGYKQEIFLPPISGSAAKIVCGDIDNDGDNDIVLSNYNSYYGGITVYENSLITTDIKSESEIPTEYQLLGNYPNPFNPSTTIKYILPKESSVYLRIYDIMGREIKTFIINSQPAGVSEIKWDGTNNNCIKVSSGVYIYKIKLQGLKDLDIYEKSAKLILSK